jgi:hypothetical protein
MNRYIANKGDLFMHTPTPPIKPLLPIPPTPPSINATSSEIPSNNTPASASTSKSSASPYKSEVEKTEKDVGSLIKAFQNPTANVVSGIKKSSSSTTSAAPPGDSTQVPPVTSFGTAAETSPNTVVPLTPPLSASKNMSLSFSFFFILIVITAIVLITFRWWKKTKTKRRIVDYSSASSEELIALITNGTSLASIPTILPKIEPLPKSKGNFEIRV